MAKTKFSFSRSATELHTGENFSFLKTLSDPSTTVLITDENVAAAHSRKFKGWKTIVTKPGEKNKTQSTVNAILQELIEVGCDRNYTLVGVGGGVVTDITGFVASIYMRGIRFGFVPTSLLCMVDASIGGKNGIDIGPYKNIAGTINQPAFILHDVSFLSSLPGQEFSNGFAEIIKHAAIKDSKMFRELEEHDAGFYMNKKNELAALLRKNATLKFKTVMADEFEKGERRFLNFGHTLGHAIENVYRLSHGQAISVGMAFAARLSSDILSFTDEGRLVNLLEKYGLPFHHHYQKNKVIEILKMDKKKEKDNVNFILLEKIGKAAIKKISIDHIYRAL
jgi:3-dehydroquinate synthase